MLLNNQKYLSSLSYSPFSLLYKFLLHSKNSLLVTNLSLLSYITSFITSSLTSNINPSLYYAINSRNFSATTAFIYSISKSLDFEESTLPPNSFNLTANRLIFCLVSA